MFKLRHSIFYTFVFVITLQASSFAQTMKPVKWTFNVEQDDDEIVTFSANANIAENWNVYSLHIGPDGPIPTSLEFEDLVNLVLEGQVEESGNGKTHMDEMFSMKLKKFKNNASFTQKFKKTQSGEGRLSGFVTFMCCNDKQCLPPTDVEFDLKVD